MKIFIILFIQYLCPYTFLHLYLLLILHLSAQVKKLTEIFLHKNWSSPRKIEINGSITPYDRMKRDFDRLSRIRNAIAVMWMVHLSALAEIHV